MKSPIQPPKRPAVPTSEKAKAGYPLYPPKDDIYAQLKEAEDVDPADTTKMKIANEREEIESRNEKDFSDDLSGDDLDVPGSELDDAAEAIGNEDEENNIYSLGGDAHNSLDEN